MKTTITFRNLNQEDYKLIHRWIKENPFVKKWYFFDRQPRLETLRKKYEKKIKNEENVIYRIFQINGTDVGYIQGYDVEGNGFWTKRVKVRDKTASVDYFIGNMDFIHKGFGKKIISAFISEFIKGKGFDFVMISPDPENGASVRVCEKSGFSYVKTVGIPFENSKNKESVYLKKL